MTKMCEEKTTFIGHPERLHCQKYFGHKGMHEHVIEFRWGNLEQYEFTNKTKAKP